MSADIERLIEQALNDMPIAPNLAAQVAQGYHQRRHRRRIAGALTAASLVVVGVVVWAVAAGTTSAGLSTVIPVSPPGPTSEQPSPKTVTDVNLVAAPPVLREQCLSAANRLGFAVACPSRVPALAGRGMACPPPQGAALAPCVGLEGLPTYRVFVLQLSGFDVPHDYVGVDGKAAGQLVVEARPHHESPPNPCIGALEAGTVVAGPWRTTEYTCPDNSLVAQREATHGEGTYVGHLLLEWERGGIDYIASAYGHTAVNLRLLQQLVAGTTLVSP